MSGQQDLGELMAARRADLEGATTPNGASAEVEVIPPADTAAGSEAPPETGTAPVPAGPVEVRQPGPTAPLVTPDATFPVTPPKVLGGLPYANSYSRLAFSIHNTEMVPRQFRGKPPALMAAFMYGYEVGLGPMQAANGINVIDGSAGLDAETMRALILEAGHIFVLQQGRNEETGEAWATVFCRRKDWPDSIPTAEFTWTTERGKRAGLVEWYEKWTTTNQGRNRKMVWNPHSDEETPPWVFPATGSEAELKSSSAWKNYPEAMCGARATSEAARANFADVVKGLSYTPEEIREFGGGTTGDTALPEGGPPSPTPQTSPASSTPPSDATDPSGTGNGNGSDAQLEESGSSSSDPDPEGPGTPADGSTPTAEPAKKAAAKKPAAAKKGAPAKAEPIRTPDPSSLPGATDTAPAESSQGSLSAPADQTSATRSEPESAVQPDLEGNEPPAPVSDQQDDTTPGEIRELAASLRALLQAKPQAERQIITVFLGRHFPDRKAEDLTAEELTKAIGIAAGWPGSADTYPPPEFPPTTVDGDGQPY